MADEKDENGSGAKLTPVEGIKENSLGLYGALITEIGDANPYLSDPSTQLIKHHGSYQQDDRDTRTERKKQGLDWDYKFMVRTKFPGGALSAEQYLVCDDLCGKYGQDDLRVTSRQDFQFHGVIKGNLRPLIHDLNVFGKMTSFGGCGDVVRNTMAAPVADIDQRYAKCSADLIDIARRISDHFMPKTRSYYDLWIDDEKVKTHEDGTYEIAAPKETVEDPIYGKTYLPRKFKIGLAADFDNSVDVYTQDVGIIAVTKDGAIVGYEVLAGGGLGYTHRKPETYARMATAIAFVNEDELVPLLEAIVKVQRDHGGRANRRHARMKYLIDDWGWDKFAATVFEYAGRTYAPPRGVKPTDQPDYLGWHKQIQQGLNYVGVWIENGRIRDFDGSYKFRSGLRKIVEQFRCGVRLTPHHNVILSHIRDEDVPKVQALLDAHGIPTDDGISPLRRMEMACPALPFCGLALAESERAMPGIIHDIEAAGHGDSDVIIRMSGCPNNCSRPRSAEIGIVGSGSDRYVIYTGGDFNGTRLNELVAEKLTGKDIAAAVSALLSAWKANRNNGERFGDWSARVGVDGVKQHLAGVVHV
ncbi:MAG: NADPH-dependent assimilatory sulfite reductase hemoprotein subunit [Candidatus Hydrogenedentes bacterium]|nr:NADPH-dependent assimilatory sulfite reductase hemoprotein subunit [Candidatus Hydrogenedentota bacterium]